MYLFYYEYVKGMLFILNRVCIGYANFSKGYVKIIWHPEFICSIVRIQQGYHRDHSHYQSNEPSGSSSIDYCDHSSPEYHPPPTHSDMSSPLLRNPRKVFINSIKHNEECYY